MKDTSAGNVPVVLVANKVDMLQEKERVISEHEIAEKAKQMGAQLIEASAKENLGVEAAFEQAVREHRKFAATQSPGGRIHDRKAGLAARMKSLGCSIL